MKIPKYIEAALQRRVRAAFNFLSADDVISEFIEKNNIEIDPEDYGCGVDSLLNPRESAEAIRNAILNK